jgi:hypothetical protein
VPPQGGGMEEAMKRNNHFNKSKKSIFILVTMLIVSLIGTSSISATSKTEEDTTTYQGTDDNEIIYEDVSAISSVAFTENEFKNAKKISLVNGIKGSVIDSENGKTVILKEESFAENNDLMSESVGNLMSDSTVSNVIVVSQNDENVLSAPENPRPLSLLGMPYVKNVKSISNTVGTVVIAVAQGQSGITLSINQTKSVASTISATFGAAVSVISASIGWSATGSTSISVIGSWTVPAKNNGKAVKMGYLRARSVYKRKTYDVYVYNTKKGTGTAVKAIGVEFTRTVSY